MQIGIKQVEILSDQYHSDAKEYLIDYFEQKYQINIANLLSYWTQVGDSEVGFVHPEREARKG